MKAKKIIALAMSAAMVAGTASLFAACGDDDGDKKGGDSTLIWYAVGCDTKGTLGTNMDTGWDPLNVRDEAKFTQSTTNPNEYTLSLDIYAGNVGSGYSFKFLYKTSLEEEITTEEMWGRQIGIGNVEGCEGDGETAVVKMDGVTYFTTGGGADANNMALTKGNEGTYKFTLIMKDGSDTNPSIKFEKTNAIVVSHDMYVYGDINYFGFGNGETQFPMTENINGENTTWTAQLVIGADDLKRNAAGEEVETGGKYAAVHLYNMIDKKTYHIADSTDYPEVELSADEIAVPSLYSEARKFNLFPEGRYMLTYDQSTNAITVSTATHEMYFRGSAMSWGTEITEADAQFKLNESADHTCWYGFLAVPEGATHQVKLFNAVTGDWYGPQDNYVLDAGFYCFNFDVATEKITYEKLDEKIELVVTGTLRNDEEYLHFGLADWSPRFVATEVSTIVSTTLTVYDATVENGNDWINNGNIFAWKPVFTKADGDNMVIDWDTNAIGNIMVQTAGVYTVKYNLNTHEVTYTPVQG